MKKVLPIGKDDFRKIREDESFYYVDKSLIIKDFLEFKNEVALITRPRRFGKSLNMSMISEFFDITKVSKSLFEGLAIMDTEYAKLINTKPVIYLSFKDCSADDEESLKFKLADTIFLEYERYYERILRHQNKNSAGYQRYMMLYEMMLKHEISWDYLSISIQTLERILAEYYGIKPIVLIDEYDQPIISSHEYHYHHKVNNFFSSLYGSALKGQEYLSQALLTGIQRVAKESIFSKLNNVIVYTVMNPKYQQYFGLTDNETKELLHYYDLELTDEVRQQYDGYIFGELYVYNPWSILNYANSKHLDNYWINTSTNSMIRSAIASSSDLFKNEFSQLISKHKAIVGVELETSFLELRNSETLWGLLINAGYLTVLDREDLFNLIVAIPNNEVRYEFQKIIAEQANISGRELNLMLQSLVNQELDQFFDVYSNIVLTCTSHFDAMENAYHMLFLGMCISLKGLYKITSNIESGHGRSDITLESLTGRPHMIIEFKQGDNTAKLKLQALSQILDNKYYAGLTGEILCMGIAHNKKRCEMEHKLIQV